MPDTRSLQQIKHETEQTRAGLTNTVEQLKTSVADTASDIRHRISPDVIKAEVSGYIKSRGEQLVADVRTAARNNPMQAVAVGASLAYPLLRLARAIPFPVLMVGAGLFFAGSKTGRAVTQQASDAAADFSDDVVKWTREFGDTANTAGAAVASNARMLQDSAATIGRSVADRANDLKDHGASIAGSAADNVRDTAASLADSVTRSAHDLKDESLRMASAAGATVQNVASQASTATRNAAGSAMHTGRDAVGAVRDAASDFSDRAGKTIFQSIEQNPLLVAGVGLFIGGLIASVLPRSDLEDHLVGGASNAVKQRAQEAASEGFEVAKGAAEEVYKQTTQQVESEGLTVGDLGKAAQDIGQRVRRVAEAAVTTAFEPPQENRPSRKNGATDHG